MWKRKIKLKMGKLNPNRPALSVSLEEEWNYKSITPKKDELYFDLKHCINH